MLTCVHVGIHVKSNFIAHPPATTGRIQECLSHPLQRVPQHAHAASSPRPLCELPPHIPGTRIEVTNALPALRFQSLEVAHRKRYRRQQQRWRVAVAEDLFCQAHPIAAVHQVLYALGAFALQKKNAFAPASAAVLTIAAVAGVERFTHNSANSTDRIGRIFPVSKSDHQLSITPRAPDLFDGGCCQRITLKPFELVCAHCNNRVVTSSYSVAAGGWPQCHGEPMQIVSRQEQK